MATPPYSFYAIAPSTTLSAMQNIEVAYTDFPPSAPDGYVPLTSRKPEANADGSINEDGFINSSLIFDVDTRDDLDTLVQTILGGWSVASVERVLSVLTEDGHFTPVKAYIGKPTFKTPYGGGWRSQVVFPLSRIRVQSITKTSGYTVTTSDHLIYCDTSGGSITLALSALSGFYPYVVYSAVKTSGSNTLTIDPNGSETINGASTKAVTALNSRVDYYTDGSAWYTLDPL